MDKIPQGISMLILTVGGYQPFSHTNIVIKADEQTDVSVRMGKVGLGKGYVCGGNNS